ncbi:isoleucine--tRNA ligase [bacterium]|nr:isoleucine--tRNA ligase [bacterium]
MSAKDNKEFLNLLKTDFSMRANLSDKEPKLVEFWDKDDIYGKIIDRNKDGDKKILHDGPPYANGHLHIGHALNKILKDFVVKYYWAKGYHSPYVPGWDCHGLPIELKVKGDYKGDDVTIFRKKCRDYAAKFIEIQKEEFKSLGILGDWEYPYFTMDHDYEADILEAFNKMYRKGYIYKGSKPIHWCFSCQTALAEAEVEFEDHTSPSIYVKMPLLSEENTSLVIWTTTPWTLPANLAVTVHPKFVYTRVKVGDEIWIIARDLLSKAMEEMEISEYEVLSEEKGKQLEGLKYSHPLLDKECPVILGDHVTLEQGTGCVHTAPGHGADDFQVGKKYGLDIFAPVDDKGRFTDEFKMFEGMHIFKANPLIVEKLKEKGLLVKYAEFSHSYPHCWRCHKPLIFRATPQWFIDTMNEKLKSSVLRFSKDTQWVPKWGETRFVNMIENRVDWCISRQRSWGVPIPSLVCEECEEEFIDADFTDTLVEQIRKDSTDIWFSKELKDLEPGNVKCPSCGSTKLKKGSNILDVWFDSGVSWYAVVKKKMGEDVPVDMYLEGTDQYRGWFQSSMWPAAGITGSPPYKKVLTHGFSLDANGRPMSKSRGNVISPLDVIKQYGAEILRLWVSSVDYTEDFRFSHNVLKQTVDTYKNIRNKLRFSLMNIEDFDPQKDQIEYSELLTLDRWALNQLYILINKLDSAYERFEFHKIYHLLTEFSTVTLSAQYFDMIKSRLYTSPSRSKERRSAQTVLFHMVKLLVQRMSPVLSFTAEEVFKYLFSEKESVFLEGWDDIPAEWAEWDRELDIMFELRDKVQKIMEDLRANKEIGLSLDASLTLSFNNDKFEEILNNFDLREFFIVSEVILKKDMKMPETYKIDISKAPGEKCSRCWSYNTELSAEGICRRCEEQIDRWNEEG